MDGLLGFSRGAKNTYSTSRVWHSCPRLRVVCVVWSVPFGDRFLSQSRDPISDSGLERGAILF